MKIVNIILSILILVLALVSAVFSYFLFEKRMQFVDGWNKFARSINETSATLDSDSGTATAKKLTVKTLAHEKYADLGKLLPELNKQGKAVIDQRNAMGDMFLRIAKKLGLPGESAQFRSLETYSGRINEVNNGVVSTVNNRDKIYAKLSSVMRSYGCTVDAAALRKGDEKPVDAIRTMVDKTIRTKDTYRNGLRSMASQLGTGTQISDDKGAEAVSRIQSAFQARMKDFAERKRALEASQATVLKLENSLKKCEGQLNGAKNKISDMNREMLELKRLFGVADDFRPWLSGSAEARARLQAHVTLISDAYGYLVVDLGSATTVMQQSKDKKVAIKVLPESGMELTVVRPDGDDFVYVTTLVLDKVGENESTANVPAGSAVKVGDLVFLKAPENLKK